MSRSRSRRRFGAWTIGADLGSGGNGNVYKATDGTRTGAIKVLRVWDGDRLDRFRAEIEATRRCQDIPGVLPLFDSHCPEHPAKGDRPWYAMGLATRLQVALGDTATLPEVIRACLQIAETLTEVHRRGMSHRDIKPANLFFYQGRFAIGDFGLVSFPNKAAVTVDGKKLGPTFYIPDEMLNNPTIADGAKADVYSFAKTMWVLVSGQNYPVQGQLDRTNPAITLRSCVSDPRAGLLDRLLEAATAFNPDARPSMGELASELRAWLRPPPLPTGLVDVSDLASDIAGLNSRHEVDDRRVRANQQRIETDGLRIRETLRPFAEQTRDALEAAGFLSTRLAIDNVAWGFEIRGHVLAASGPGEATLHIACVVEIPGEERPITARSRVEVEVNFGRGPQTRLLHADSVSFRPASPSEEVEINSLIMKMKEVFRPSVQEVIRLARNSLDAGVVPQLDSEAR